MVTVPRYDTQQTLTSEVAEKPLGVHTSPDMFGSSIAEAQARAGRTAGNVGDLADQILESDGKAQAFASSTKAELDIGQAVKQLETTAPPGGNGFSKSVITYVGERYKALIENEQNPYARSALVRAAQTSQLHYGNYAENWEAEQNKLHRITLTQSAIDNQSKILSSLAPGVADAMLPEMLKQTEENIDSDIMPPAEKDKLKEYAKKNMAYATAYGQAVNYPKEFLASSGGGSTGAIETVLAHEGGFVASDGATGAPAIYGINAKWHPDEFAKAKEITDARGEEAGKDYARDFYKREYYDKYDISSLPPAVQTTVLDGVVNHSTDFSKKMVAAAKDGASNEQLISMRDGEYKRLDASGKYPGQIAGWSARLDNLRGGGAGGDMAVPTGEPQNSRAFDMLNFTDQRQLTEAASASIERNIRVQEKLQDVQNKKTQNEFLTKFYDDKLDVKAVMESNLPAFGQGSKSEYMELLRKKPELGNPQLHQQLYAAALSGEISDPSQLVQYMTQSNGINTQQAQNIASILEKGKDDVVKMFTTGAKSQITGATEFLPDREGDAQYSAFLFDLQNTLSKGAAKGLSARDLLDPASKEYVGDKLISTYRRTQQERIKSMSDSIVGKAAVNDPDARQPSESLAEWARRTRGK